MCNQLDRHGEMVEETARGAVWRVDGAHEAPGVRQQGPLLSGSHLLEEGATMDGPEVGHVTHSDETSTVQF